ncbi:MAG: hypothetical protein P8I55_11200 [Crocinitomix sp.]|nr:hypothetical protein [Crocinitomix sp.]
MTKPEERALMIDKSEIGFLHFPKEDVLYSFSDKVDREKELKKALSLGNLDHFKVKINFQDIEGFKNVETTIWGLTNTRVILKKGVTIPIARVNGIEFI